MLELIRVVDVIENIKRLPHLLQNHSGGVLESARG